MRQQGRKEEGDKHTNRKKEDEDKQNWTMCAKVSMEVTLEVDGKETVCLCFSSTMRSLKEEKHIHV